MALTNNLLPPTELAYIAGFIDGDGCISCTPKSTGRGFRLSLSFSNIEYKVVELVKEKFGVSNKINEYHHPNCRQKFVLSLTGSKAKSCIQQIEPFLKLKRELAKLALTFPVNEVGICLSNDKVENQKEIYHRMKLAGCRTLILQSNSNTSDIAWLAGFFDADGNIHISKAVDKGMRGHLRFRLMMLITNTSREILQCCMKVIEGFGCRGGIDELQRKRKGNRKPAFRLWIYGAYAQRVLHLLLPYLIIKRERALVAITFPTSKTRRTFRERNMQRILCQKMKIFNIRGLD